MYTPRFYRTWVSPGRLCRFRIIRNESDIEIAAERDLSLEACEALYAARMEIEEYCKKHPDFLTSFSPVRAGDGAPGIVRKMAGASLLWDVGPMASVAGAVAAAVGESISAHSETVIAENGGDVYVRSPRRVNCVLYAGAGSPFSGRIRFSVHAPDGMGICTSSGTVGHSFSRGRAAAVTVIAVDCAEADSAATAIANRISAPRDVDEQLETLEDMAGVDGVIACCGHRLASRGVSLTGIEEEDLR